MSIKTKNPSQVEIVANDEIVSDEFALPVKIISGGGGGGGGTEYTEDAAAPANPVGPMTMAVRRDTLSASEVSADGDVIAVKATSKGQLHVYAEVIGGGGGSSDATAANQVTGNNTLTTIAGHVDGLETAVASTNSLLTTQNGYLDQVEGYVDGIETAIGSTNTLLTTQNTYLDGVEAAITATNTKLDTVIASLTTIDGRVDGLETLVGTTNTQLIAANAHLTDIEAVAENTAPTVTSRAPYTVARAITPNTNVTAGQGVLIVCTLPGNQVLELSSGNLITIAVVAGTSFIDNLAVIDAPSSGTTATASVTVLAVS